VDRHVLDDLEWRGLIAHSTDLDALRAEMAKSPITVYCGFDPTHASLHMGNLLQLVTVRRLQNAGHRPIGLVGGATGMIGDPKEAGERRLNPVDVVTEWTERIRVQVAKILSFDGDNAAIMANNYDWTKDLSTIDFLRDIGKHFPVNRMLARDVVRSRLEDGISYTEFSYVLLQSMDYLRLFERYGCRLQTGGSDQWGNLTGGVDLIRRVTGERVHALATPLITKSDGTKYGKTEGDAVWLDPQLMSPYAFYQFWFNVDDADVVPLLKYFTFRSRDEIEALDVEVAEKPYLRTAQRALADDITTVVHGPDETARVVAASEALFGSGDLSALEASTLDAALSEIPGAEIADAPELPSVVDLLVASGLADSKGAARRTINEGGAYVNNERVLDAEARPDRSHLLGNGWLVLRRGRRQLAGVRIHRDR
jgi:tyrosyl-tRNA synthetase